jgi:hypothetical protein
MDAMPCRIEVVASATGTTIGEVDDGSKMAPAFTADRSAAEEPPIQTRRQAKRKKVQP